MKSNFFILTLLIFIISCEKTEENNTTVLSTIENKFVPKFGNQFFEYDKIEYFKNEIDSINTLDVHQNISKLSKLKYEVILGDVPKDLNDDEFLDSLEKMDFHKSEINKSKFGEINKIFIEKTVNQTLDYACTAVYRDILIFKKHNKTVGIAKICFECFKNQIVGTNVKTDNFGQDGDYEKLEKILTH